MLTGPPLILAAFAAVDWLIIVAYLALMLGIGAWASRGQADEHSYFLGSRKMPTWAVALSVLATSLSAATYIGVPQLGFTGDLTYLMLNLGGLLAVVIVATVFIPPLYRAGTVTIYGYLGRRFGPGAMVAASVVFLFGRLLASGARLFMAGIAFSLILFDQTTTAYVIAAIVLFGVIGTAYTCMGGIKAVIWTDTMQIVMVIGAALLCIYVLMDRLPMSAGEVLEALRNAGADGKTDKLAWYDAGFDERGSYDWGASFTIITAFAVTFANVGAFGTDQDLVQRMMTTRSAWRASLSVIAAQLLGMPVVLLFLIIGLLLSLYFATPGAMPAYATATGVDDTRGIYPQFLVHHLPAGLSGLTMAGLFAAAMSSLDSAINAMASTAVADLRNPRRRSDDGTGSRHQLSASRWMVVGMGALLTVFAVGAAIAQRAGGQTLIDFALGVMSFAYAGLLGVFLTALLTRRGNTASVIVALIVGALIVALLQPWALGPITEALVGEPFRLAWPFWMPIASTVALLVCLIPRGQPPPEAAP
jgi:SSS family transporter